MIGYEQFLGLAGFPVVAAIVQVFKPWLPDDKWNPPLALALGILLNVAIAYQQKGDIVLGVLIGIVTGLAASGLYSQAKAYTA
jgi:hypothetical protein